MLTVPAAALKATPVDVVAEPPIVPDIVVWDESPSPCLVIAPILEPKAAANVEVTSTTKASINTCLVFTSISLITLSITSKSSL